MSVKFGKSLRNCLVPIKSVPSDKLVATFLSSRFYVRNAAIVTLGLCRPAAGRELLSHLKALGHICLYFTEKQQRSTLKVCNIGSKLTLLM